MANQLNMTLFSKRLKEARTDINMTQKELSEISGVSTVMLSAYERNNTQSGKNPALNNIYAIATALGVSIDWLCGLSEETYIVKDKSEVDTESFLYAVVELVNNIYSTYKYHNEFGYSKVTNTEIFDNIRNTFTNFFIKDSVADGELCFLNFITEYLNIKAVIEQKVLPEITNDTLVYAVVEKFKNQKISKMFSILEEIEDELPF